MFKKTLQIIFIFLAVTAQAQAVDYSKIERLAQSGAYQLSKKLLLSNQPSVITADQWLTVSVRLAEQYDDSDWLHHILSKIGNDTPVVTQHWAITKRAQAAIRDGDAKLVRQLLIPYIWRVNNDTIILRQREADWLPRWRRMVIESYLLESDLASAEIAAALYRQDYALEQQLQLQAKGISPFPENYKPISSQHMAGIEGRIALMQGNYNQAWKHFQKTDRTETTLIKLFASLNAQPEQALKTAQLAIAFAQESSYVRDKQTAYIIAAKAYEKIQDPVNQVANILKAAALMNNRLDAENFLQLTEGWFWNELALVGQKWALNRDLAVLEEELKISRLIFVVNNKTQTNNDALFKLARLLKSRENGTLLFKNFFLNVLPEPIKQQQTQELKYLLVEALIEQQDIHQASNLLAQITTAPSGVDNFAWQLRRARVFVLGDKLEKGVGLLRELAKTALASEQYDRWLQVVFDAQVVGASDDVLELLQLAERIALTQAQRRELFFWQGDALKNMKAHQQAAAAYLQSADYVSIRATDRWAVTARLQAAEQLEAAALYQDAAELYKFLLATSTKRNIQAMLRNRLQRLSALKSR